MCFALTILCVGILATTGTAQITPDITGITGTTGTTGVTGTTGTLGTLGTAGTTDITGTLGTTGGTTVTPSAVTPFATGTDIAPVNPLQPGTITGTNTQVGGFNPIQNFASSCGTGAVATVALSMMGLALMKGRHG